MPIRRGQIGRNQLLYSPILDSRRELLKLQVSPGVHPTLLILVDDPVDDVGQQDDEGPHPAEADQHVDVAVRYYEAVHQHPETVTKKITTLAITCKPDTGKGKIIRVNFRLFVCLPQPSLPITLSGGFITLRVLPIPYQKESNCDFNT